MKPLQALHQIEISSECNLACKYCVHPSMKRAKQHMTQDVFTRALDLVHHFHSRHGQKELSLHGIGESTLHPLFTQFITQARKALPNITLTTAINGITLSKAQADSMAENNVYTWVSLHRPERANAVVNLLRERGILAGVSNDPSMASINWAGQIDWPQTAPAAECMWQATAKAICFSDGRIGSCGLDGQGADGVIGSVWDAPETLIVRPYSLCAKCYQHVSD